MSQNPILAVIERLQFRVAVTMPHLPHQYTVRGKGGSLDDFATLEAAIKASPVKERWRGRRKPYLYPGDGFKYWVNPPVIINRMRTEDDLERLRAEGQIL